MNQPIFNEEDIREIFSVKTGSPPDGEVRIQFQPEIIKPARLSPAFNKSKSGAALILSAKTNILQLILKYIGVFVLIFIISFTVINSQALIIKIKYFWNSQYHKQSMSEKPAALSPSSGVSSTSNISNESRLLIPKISVNAPIIWNVNPDDTISALQNGVAQYAGSAIPGAAGNIFITGHSSYYLWAPGSYKDVFALLDNLDIGDKIYIQYKGATFSYQVSNHEVVSANDLKVISGPGGSTLTLMTCYPVGTNLRRLIVIANQVE